MHLLQIMSQNPSLFDLDYLAMSKVRTRIIHDELLAKTLHPSKIETWLEHHLLNGGKIDDFEY